MRRIIHIMAAGNDVAERYEPKILDDTDRRYLQRYGIRETQAGWKVSRYLKSLADSEKQCNISHCADGAAVAAWESGRAGVDLETVRQRDFQAWHDLVLHPQEHEWLKQRDGGLADYYALWTLKEALIKASKGSLADIRDVGLRPVRGKWLPENGSGTVWRAAAYIIDGKYMLCCVWDAENADVSLQCFGAWQFASVTEYPLVQR